MIWKTDLMVKAMPMLLRVIQVLQPDTNCQIYTPKLLEPELSPWFHASHPAEITTSPIQKASFGSSTGIKHSRTRATINHVEVFI